MTNDQDIEQFRAAGVVSRPQSLPEDLVASAVSAMQTCLHREGLWRNNDWSLDHLSQPLLINAGAPYARALRGESTFKQLVQSASDAAQGLVGDLPTTATTVKPQVLFTLPTRTAWQVPTDNWHLDLPRLAIQGCPGFQIFTFLAPLEPGGGGTMAVAGSHRLLNDQGPLKSKEVRRRLGELGYFRDLFGAQSQRRDRFMQEWVECEGVPLRVVEMCGQPGDVVVMDLRVLHTASLNTASAPRVMLTQRFVLDTHHEHLASGRE